MAFLHLEDNSSSAGGDFPTRRPFVPGNATPFSTFSSKEYPLVSLFLSLILARFLGHFLTILNIITLDNLMIDTFLGLTAFPP